jgi:hypothetical protein
MGLVDLRQYRLPLRANRRGCSRDEQANEPEYSSQRVLHTPAYYAKKTKGTQRDCTLVVSFVNDFV